MPVFLSYASVDRARVEDLVKALESEGLDVWWDRNIPSGKNFNRVIEEALRQARCAIVVWSHAAIDSEWVFNEASEARKRRILLPVLIDDVEPPLEFRHLQAARLIGWHGDKGDPEWIELLKAVRDMASQPNMVDANRNVTRTATERRWWQTPAGIGLGIGALLVGASTLLFALKQVGILGKAEPVSISATPAVVSTPSASATSTASPTAAASEAAPLPAATADASSTATNLIDSEQGGKLIIASEDAWRDVTQKQPRTTVIGIHGFAVFAFHDERPATIDTVSVYVESTNARNLKELTVYAADQSETGPFRKVATITLPNYRNMRAPMHDIKVDPFTARYVKVEIASWQNADGMPNGYVGNIQLHGRLR